MAQMPVDLHWDNLVYTVDVTDPNDSKQKIPKQLLKGLSGTARQGRLLAIMGPSGAGKSTLMNAVCGRLLVNDSQRLNGVAYLNDVLFVGKYKSLVSFVAQDDIVMGKDTPREALEFSYRMNHECTAAEADDAVNKMLEELSLTKCADTLLGLPGLIKGVSGGEKKRSNIGSELINNPLILMLDEPTTGLDSVNALRVGQLLRKLANDEKRTVVCTIHSPSSELYDVFDDLLLLADGHTIYHGDREGAPKFFASVGHPVPPRTNPSEHFMKVLQLPVDELQVIADKWREYASSDAAAENLSINQTPKTIRTNDATFDKTLATSSVGLGTELLLLTRRSWRNTMRDPGAVFGRLIQTLFFAILMALFYANLSKDDAGVTDRAGVLFMQVINLVMMMVMSALTVFPPERAVFLQEQTNSTYSPVVYYLSKVIAEFPLTIFFPVLYVIITYFSWGLVTTAEAFFLHLAIAVSVAYCGNAFGMFAASMFPNPEMALTITPLFIMPMMIAGGLFANTERLEPEWHWLNFISFVRYAYKALFKVEFNNVEGLCPNPPCRFNNGEDVINFYGFNHETYDAIWFNILMINVMMIVFRILGAIGLSVQGAATRSRLVFEENYSGSRGDAVEMHTVSTTK